MQVQMLVFDGASQALNQDIVEHPPTAIHTDLHLGRFEQTRKPARNELAALIAVEDRRCGGRQCLLECLATEAAGMCQYL